MARKVRIAHLYPNELNLYGDSGNILCLEHRLSCRGFSREILTVGIGDRLPDFDILFIGGGQDKEMSIIAPDLRRKAEALNYYIHSGRVVLAICGGYQILGEYYKDAQGNIIDLCDVLPFFTVAGSSRLIGNIVTDTPFGKVVGFENHSGKTYLSTNLDPLGTVISGYGNNGEDATEGLLYKNTFCTYCHGPVLPKNPRLADELISRALGEEPEPIDDYIENQCHNAIIKITK